MHDTEIERLDRLANLLDSKFQIPGTGIRFGLDSIIGLIPGFGDLVTVGPTAFLVHRAYLLGASRRTILRMVANTAVDWLIGSIPLIGDVFDLAFKANNRNVALLRKDLARKSEAKVFAGNEAHEAPI